MKIRCDICFRGCILDEGQAGFCRIRINEKGQNKSRNYGKLSALALDPIEKKPLARFYPGSYILSAGGLGCNMRCPFCQNWHISMTDSGRIYYYSPKELVELAKEAENNIGIAFTYNEPSINYEYIIDCAKLLKEVGLKCVLVTNGCVSPSIWNKLLPYIDAMNIDLKCFDDEGYRKLGGDFQTVLQNIEAAAKVCHVELTTLIVPGISDDPSDMEKEAKWIASVNKDIVLHVTRYFPAYKMNEPATRVKKVYELADTARRYLNYVYVGNV